jgi:hypothetical protein
MQMIAVLLTLLVGMSAEARPLWSVGTAMEARMQREVNPDYYEASAIGQLFAQASFGKWAALLEVGQDSSDSSSGGVSVDNDTLSVGAWGRYSLAPERKWRPVAGLGLGAYFDKVTSTYGSSSSERRGERYFGGAGVGLSHTFFKHMLIEGEGRAALIEDRKDPLFSVLLRLGVEI